MPCQFMLSQKTTFLFTIPMTPAVRKAEEIFQRDMRAVLTSPTAECPDNQVILRYAAEKMPAESYVYAFSETPDCDRMEITAADELGVVYALLHLSGEALKIPPFWFYQDYRPEKIPYAALAAVPYLSPRYKVRYRGWFINDEVLTLGWHADRYDPAVWEPAFEALLRCGGNMVIPGTGETHRHIENIAVGMGLYLTEHHAEPLGAEMFASAFPDKEPSYDKYPELFRRLWRTAIEQRKDDKVIWTLGFRGQGDRPFWENDPAYVTPQSRGALISRIIREQYDMLREFVKDPVCCTNLYGEIMELYRDGYISVPAHVVKIWADNGYGKMVSRRQWNRNPRVYSLPSAQDEGPHGLYYHLTFHDLQASNHLTMLPNPPEFVNWELNLAFQAGADEFLILNSGNIRMHTYTLDLVSRIWRDGDIDVQKQGEEFATVYFPQAAGMWRSATAPILLLRFNTARMPMKKLANSFTIIPRGPLFPTGSRGTSRKRKTSCSGWQVRCPSPRRCASMGSCAVPAYPPGKRPFRRRRRPRPGWAETPPLSPTGRCCRTESI